MKILALDGDSNTCVTSVRSLARAGHHVIVGAPNKHSKAGWSRFCAGTFRYLSPQIDIGGFVASVAAQVEPGTLVLPFTEPTTLALSKYREAIVSKGGRLVLPSHDSLIKAHDKVSSIELAASCGFEVPKTFVVANEIELGEITSSIPYPVVIKARTSEQASAGKMVVSPPPIYANNKDELIKAVRSMRRYCSSMLIQEYIPGRGAGYFAVMNGGDLRAEFAHIRLREVRPTGSGSCLRMSVRVDDHVRAASLRMLRELQYHGAVMVEYRIRPDGTPVFMEINPRICNSVALAVYSGVNIPLLVSELAETGDVREPVYVYRVGVRCRWIVGDLRHLLSVLKGKPRNFPGAFPSRWQALRDVLLPVAGTYHDPFELGDPLPELGDWVHSLQRYGDRFLRKVAAKLGGGSMEEELAISEPAPGGSATAQQKTGTF